MRFKRVAKNSPSFSFCREFTRSGYFALRQRGLPTQNTDTGSFDSFDSFESDDDDGEHVRSVPGRVMRLTPARRPSAFFSVILGACLIVGCFSDPAQDERLPSLVVIRFFKDDHEQIDDLRTGVDYKLDMLAKGLENGTWIYLIRRGDFPGEEIAIDPENDIPLQLLAKPNGIKNKFSNRKYLSYLSKKMAIVDLRTVEQPVRFLYSQIRFDAGQEGDYRLCLPATSSSTRCTCQGIDSYLTFSVNSPETFGILLVISVFALSLFLSALTSALTLGIMSLDTHELQVLIK